MVRRILSLFLSFGLALGPGISFGAIGNAGIRAIESGLWGLEFSGELSFLYKDDISLLELEAYLLACSYPSSMFWVNLHPFLAPEQLLSPILQSNDVGWVFLEADLQLKKDLQEAVKHFGVLFDSHILSGRGYLLRAWIEPDKVIVVKYGKNFIIKEASFKVRVKSRGEVRLRSWQKRKLESWLTERVNNGVEYSLLRKVFRAHLLGRVKAKYFSFIEKPPVNLQNFSRFKWNIRLYQGSYIDLLHRTVAEGGLFWAVGGITFSGKGKRLEIVKVPNDDFYNLQIGCQRTILHKLLKTYSELLNERGEINEKDLRQRAVELLINLPEMSNSGEVGLSEAQRILLLYSLPGFGEEEVRAIEKMWIENEKEKKPRSSVFPERDLLRTVEVLSREQLRLGVTLLRKFSRYATNPKFKITAGLYLLGHYPDEVVNSRYDLDVSGIDVGELMQADLLVDAEFPLLTRYVLGVITAQQGKTIGEIIDVLRREIRKDARVCYFLGFLAGKTVAPWLLPSSDRERVSVQEEINQEILMLINGAGAKESSQIESLIGEVLDDVINWNEEVLSKHIMPYVQDVVKIVIGLLNRVSEQEIASFLNQLSRKNPEFLYVLVSNEDFTPLLRKILQKEKDEGKEFLEPYTVLRIYGINPYVGLAAEMSPKYIATKNKDKFPTLAKLLEQRALIWRKPQEVVNELESVYKLYGIDMAEIYLRLVFESSKISSLEVMKKICGGDKEFPPILKLRAYVYWGELAFLSPSSVRVGREGALQKIKAKLAREMFNLWEQNADDLKKMCKEELIDRVARGLAPKFALEDEFLVISLALGEKFLKSVFEELFSEKTEKKPEDVDLLYRFLYDSFGARFMYRAGAVANAIYEVDRLHFLLSQKGPMGREEFLLTLSHEVGYALVNMLIRIMFGRGEVNIWLEATKDRYIRTIDEFLANYVGMYFSRELFGQEYLDRMLKKFSERENALLIKALSEGQVFLYTLTSQMLAANKEIFSLMPVEFFTDAVREFYTRIKEEGERNRDYVEVLRSFYLFLRRRLLMERERSPEKRISYLDSGSSAVELLLGLLANASSEGQERLEMRLGRRERKPSQLEDLLGRLSEQALSGEDKTITGEDKTKLYEKIVSSIKEMFRFDPLKAQAWAYILADKDRKLGLYLLEKELETRPISSLRLLPKGESREAFLEEVERISERQRKNPYIVAMVVLAQKYFHRRGIVFNLNDLWKDLEENTKLNLWLEEVKKAKAWVQVTNLFPFDNPDFGSPETRARCYEDGLLPEREIEDRIVLLGTRDSGKEIGFRFKPTILGTLYPAYLAYLSTKILNENLLSTVKEISPEEAAEKLISLFEERIEKQKKQEELKPSLVEAIREIDFYQALARFSALLEGDKAKARRYFENIIFPMLVKFFGSKKEEKDYLKSLLDDMKYTGAAPPNPSTLAEWFVYWIGSRHGAVVDLFWEKFLKKEESTKTEEERKDAMYKELSSMLTRLVEVATVVPKAVMLFRPDKAWLSKMDEKINKEMDSLRFLSMDLEMIGRQLPIDGGLESKVQYEELLTELKKKLDECELLHKLSSAWMAVLKDIFGEVQFIFEKSLLPVGIAKDKDGKSILFIYRPWGEDTIDVFESAKRLFDIRNKDLDYTIELLRKFEKAGFLLTAETPSPKAEETIEGDKGDLLVFELKDGFSDINALLERGCDQFVQNGYDLVDVFELNGKFLGLLSVVQDRPLIRKEAEDPIISEDIVTDENGLAFKMAVLAELNYRGPEYSAVEWIYEKLKMMAASGIKEAQKILKEATRERDRLLKESAKGGIEFAPEDTIMILSR